MTSTKTSPEYHMKSLWHLYDTHAGKVADKWSNYIDNYERILLEYRDKPISLLEIGVQNGGSLEIWAKYFTRANVIIGCDINPACRQLDYDDPRIKIVIGNVTSDATESDILDYADAFDIIIDDGSHQSGDIIRSFAKYFPHVAENGIYIIEDLCCSYWQDYNGGLYHPHAPQAFLKHLTDIINQQHWGLDKSHSDYLSNFFTHHGLYISDDTLSTIHSILFSNSLCIIYKHSINNNEPGTRIVAGLSAQILPDTPGLHGQPFPVTDQSSNEFSTQAIAVNDYSSGLANIFNNKRYQKIKGLLKAVVLKARLFLQKIFR